MDSFSSCVMKPALPKIDPAKRTVVPPEPEFSPQEALKLVRVFIIALVVPLVFEIAACFTPSKTNLAAVFIDVHLVRHGSSLIDKS